MTSLRHVVAVLLLVVAVSSPVVAAAAQDQADKLAALAIKANPTVAASKTQVEALTHRIRRADAWLEPRLALEYSNIPIDSGLLGDHPMSGLQIKLQQTFLFPGKTRLRKAVARAEVSASRWMVKERELQLGASVKQAYYKLTLARQLRDVTREHIKLIDQFLDVVRIKYEVGKVAQHDLLRLQVLRGQLADDIKRFYRDERSLSAAINAALHRRLGIAIATPARLTIEPPAREVSALLAAAKRHRPLLRYYSQQAAVRQLASQRATREGYPDLTAWIGYRVRLDAGTDPGTDFFSVGLSLPLPLFNDSRYASLKRAALARSKASEQHRAAELDTIRSALADALARWQRAADQARSYRTTLVPQAHRTLDATFAAYQVGRADFSSLYQTELQLLQFEQTIRQAETTAELARVQIEALTGKPAHGR